MRKTLLCILAASAFIATPALATNPNDGDDPPGCNPSGQTPQKCDGDVNNGGNGGNGGAGGDGGTGVGVGIGVGVGAAEANAESTAVAGAIATGGNATAAGGSATATTGAISNTNTATGGAGGAGGAGGSANSGGNVLHNETNYKRNHRFAPPAVAPVVMIGRCQKSTSVGISTFYGGIGFGGSRGDKFCQLQELANWFASQGRVDVACRLLYNNDRRVAQALTDSGVGCPAYAPPTPVQLPVTPPVPPRQPENG